MYIQAYMDVIASRLVYVGTQFIALGVRIQGVYLIGQYLASPFYNVGSFIVQVAGFIANVGDDWQNTYLHIISKLDSITDTSTLMQYANRLIAFIINPIPTIFSTLRTLYPSLDQLVDNTYATIKPYVVSIIHEILGAVQDISAIVGNILIAEIQDFNLLRANAGQWIYNHLLQYAGNLSAILKDPDGWMIAKIRAYFPDLTKILDNPVTYVLDKVVEGLEKQASGYISRLAKVVENILSQLF